HGLRIGVPVSGSLGAAFAARYHQEVARFGKDGGCVYQCLPFLIAAGKQLTLAFFSYLTAGIQPDDVAGGIDDPVHEVDHVVAGLVGREVSRGDIVASAANLQTCGERSGLVRHVGHLNMGGGYARNGRSDLSALAASNTPLARVS